GLVLPEPGNVAEFALEPCSRGGRAPARGAGIIADGANGDRQRLRIVAADEHRFHGSHDIGHAAYSSRDDRHPSAHRLEKDYWSALGPRAQHKDVESTQEPASIPNRAMPNDTRRDTQRMALARERRPFAPIANHRNEHRQVAELCGGREQHVGALLPTQAANVADGKSLVWNRK